MRGYRLFTLGLLVGVVGTILFVRLVERDEQTADEIADGIQHQLELLEQPSA